MTVDEAQNKLLALYQNSTTGPWRVATSADDAADDWPLAWHTGCDDDGKDYHICTNNVRASELVSGGAKADAEMIVAFKNDVPVMLNVLLEELNSLRTENQKLHMENSNLRRMKNEAESERDRAKKEKSEASGKLGHVLDVMRALVDGDEVYVD